MKSFATAYERIGTESAFAVGPEIAGWINQGYDIVRLNIGEPGCNITDVSTAAAIASFKRHETHYTPSTGAESLRKEIAGYLSATRLVKYDANDIVVTPGGKPVIAGTIFILVNPGEEVIYQTPGYPIYESMVNYVGARAIPIQLKEEKGFRFDIKDLKRLVSKKTKLLILNSPSNPTGGVLERSDLEEIANLAKKYDFYVLTDEIYSRLAFAKDLRVVKFKGNKLPVTDSIATQSGMIQRTVILDGFSKTYAMTGLRLGYAASKIPKFMDKFLTFAINFWSSVPQPCMAAAEAALGEDQSETQKEIRLYQEKRDMMVPALNRIEGIRCHNPKGSFYLFPNVSGVCKKLKLKDAEDLRRYLLTYDKRNKKGVAVLARKHFGKRLPSEKEEYIRISFAGSLASLKEGVRRIKEAVEG
ncbi:aminotransferase class I/II-fold pyridoxal phosphate-dependent enzyme [Candidatus Gottesmanbacteria bacterium]|nr:aminotransferase class I/II-fold pyridoxal phosphate-dependent enzyme [Candidatus Gottesmanbacteria bacterium]